MSRLDSREYHWFVLCVPPQREKAVKIILTDVGFATFVPMKFEPKFANRAARARMKKTQVELPIMPGYCFLGMNSNTPGWAGALRFRIITGILWHGGKPYEVPHDTRPGHKGRDGAPDVPERPGLRDLMWRHNAGAFNAPGHHSYMQTHDEFEEGDNVTSIAGLEGRVTKITGNRAKFLVNILGGEHEVEIALVNLRRA